MAELVTKTIELKKIEFCKIPEIRSELKDFLGIMSIQHLRTKILNSFIKAALLKLTIPGKLTTPTHSTFKGNILLSPACTSMYKGISILSFCF